MVQPVDLTKYPNSAGWRVEHDQNIMMYVLVNKKGSKAHGVYTDRRFAEKALQDMLGELAKPIRSVGRPPKKEDKDAPLAHTDIVKEEVVNG